MKLKTPFKVLTTAALIGTLSLSAIAPGAASAATENKVTQQEEKANYDIKKIILTKTGQAPIALTQAEYNEAYTNALLAGEDFQASLNGYTPVSVVTGDDSVYSLADYNEAYADAILAGEKAPTTEEVLKGLTAKEAPKDLVEGSFGKDGLEGAEPTEPTEPTDPSTPEAPVIVETVSAITQTIAASEATELEFEVNGEKYTKTTFDKKFGEEGYKAEFKFSFSNATEDEKAGKVTATEDFKYAVQITDKDGEKVNTVANTDFAQVTVADATEAVKVNELGLKTENDGKTVDFKNSTVLSSEEVSIAATVFENKLGQKNTDKKADGTFVAPGLLEPNIKKVTSNDPSVAIYSKDKIKVLGDGEVTFTVEFDGIEEKSTITVKVQASEQKLTKATAEDKKVANTATGLAFDVKFFDEKEEAYRGNKDDVTYTSTLAGEKEGEKSTSLPTAFEKEGTYTINIYNKDTKIGSFKVESVKVNDDAKIDAFELAYAKDSEENAVTELDINPLLDASAKSTVLTATGSINEIVQADLTKIPTGATLVAKSSDAKIAKVDNTNGVVAKDSANIGEINVTAVAEGEATITLYVKEGDIETPVASQKITVKNSATPVETLTLKKDTKVDGKAVDAKAAVVAAVTEKLDKKQIESVTPSETDGVVIVKINKEFGGKTFTLDADFVEAKLKSATVKAPVVAKDKVDAVAASQVVIGGKTLVFGTDYNDVDELVTAINTINEITVTASKSGDNVLLTAKDAGTTGNDIEYKLNDATEASKLTGGADATEATATITFADVDTEAVEEKAAVEAADGLLTLVFDNAVKLQGTSKNLNITIQGEQGTVQVTEATVSADGKTVTAKIATTVTKLNTTSTITKVTGLESVKGAFVENVNVTATAAQ